MLAGLGGGGIQGYVIALLDGDAQFQCINGIESETVAEQRRVRINVRWAHVLQIQRADNQLLQFFYKCAHTV